MKVKITKTIDIHQIPTEARKMLDQAKSNLVNRLPESMNQALMHSLSSQGESFFQTIDLIDSLRHDLASLDESLQEVQNILTGYKKALMPEQEEEQSFDEEWLANEAAEVEKRQAQQMDADEAENEEG
tara:strand:- start:2941 stop:3324 length:384 start_codon:yes stop_codon:yes gene_type:complete